MIIGRDELSGFTVRRYAEFPADWLRPGMTIRVQSLTERERAAVERRMIQEQEDESDKHPVSARTLLIQMALVDADGHRLYAESDLDHLESLDAMVTSRLIEAIDEHCQMVGGSQAQRIEEAEKN